VFRSGPGSQTIAAAGEGVNAAIDRKYPENYTLRARVPVMEQPRNRLRLALLATAGRAYLHLLRGTMRLEYRDRDLLERVRSETGRYILAFWHSRLVMIRSSYPDDRMVALLSQHDDAQILGRILSGFGVEQAAGSSTRGGAAGLREILRRVERGYSVGIAPDGPRGPRRKVKPGVVATARLTGLPILPVSYSARPARRLRSWDRTLLPLPFARGLFVYGEPLRVASDADALERERCRRRLELELDRLTDLADAELGLPVEEPAPAS
jgi:lysophospholipid acyltransferase (LPLAT)-like uncharacterized protein